MLYLTCTTITSVGLAHYGVSRAKDWESVDCGTSSHISYSPSHKRLVGWLVGWLVVLGLTTL